MNWYDIFVQVMGMVALLCSALSFQQKTRGKLLFLQMMANLIFSLHLFLLGAVTGAIIDFISFIRTLIFSKSEKYTWAKSPLWLVLFLVIMIVSGIFTWENNLSILPILGGLFSTVAMWMKDARKIRLVSLLVGPCWLAYNTIFFSISGILNELFAISSIIIGMIRLDIKKGRNN